MRIFFTSRVFEVDKIWSINHNLKTAMISPVSRFYCQPLEYRIRRKFTFTTSHITSDNQILKNRAVGKQPFSRIITGKAHRIVEVKNLQSWEPNFGMDLETRCRKIISQSQSYQCCLSR
ncbi:hypothetical protein SLEP1_g32548 [Rubroshorea leprosula]|uniref:Uncharacterized protein n=1 Tax=Rubroshorea leprosula TaxID=152421 RepID=A0AAV5KDT5_9ROSI|nr:hypothetical protein SLEP1_g32548 [Rubroshorea leprosula]